MRFFTLFTLLIPLLLAAPGYAQQTDYKQFGQSALEELDIDLMGLDTDLVDLDITNPIQEEQGRLGKLAAGALFFLSPVRKVKWFSALGLAALGIVACDDAGNITSVVDTPEDINTEENIVAEAGSDRATVAQNNLCPEETHFQLEGPNGACIRLPEISYRFNETTKPVLPLYGEATIYITFDSEVVFLDESGWSELTKEALLEMLDIQHEYWINDLMKSYADGIEVKTIDQKTVITIEAPFVYSNDDRNYGWFWFGNFLLTVGNYVKRDDVQKVLQSASTSDYLQSVYDQKSFATSKTCDYRQITTSRMIYKNQQEEEGQQQLSGMEIEDDEQKQLLEYLENDPNIQAQIISSRRADPNTTYYIDVAFILSEDIVYLDRFKQRLERIYIPRVNRIFQNSGVNVEFRVTSVERFSKYKRYLPCSERLLSLDGLSGTEVVDILREVAPVIKKEHEADLVYAFHRTSSGYAFGYFRRTKNESAGQAARLSSVAAIHSRIPTGGSFDGHNYFITRLARAFGYNLGLNKEEQNSEYYPDPINFTGHGHGYKSLHNLRPNYRTYVASMMASPSNVLGHLPLFSSNESLTKSEICENDPFINQGKGVNTGFGFCQSQLPGSYRIRIGDSVANSSEALQYTIKDASTYSDYSLPPEDEDS